jgi:methyl-accepting chemotaxis protein
MTDTSVRSRLFALSVGKRVVSGFVVVLALLTVLALVATRSMDTVRVGAGRVGEDSTQATASTEVALQVAEARARVVQYALSATMDDQEAAQVGLTRLDKAIEQVRSAGPAQDINLQTLAARYRGTVDATISAVEARRSAIEGLQSAGTELRTITSALVQLLERESDQAVIGAVLRVAQAFSGSDGAASRFLASRAPAEANAAGTALHALRGGMEGLVAAAAESRRVQRLVKAMTEPLDRFAAGLQLVVVADDQLRTATVERDTASAAVLSAAEAQRAGAMASQQRAIAAMLAGVSSARRLSLLTSAGAIGVGLVLALLIGRSIARPIHNLTDAMGKLAGGMLDVAIPHAERHDELGEMARAVRVFQDHMAKEALQTQQQADESRRAEEDKHAALVRMADTIESETQTAIEQIGQQTSHMAATADEMRASAARTDVSAQSAAAAAGQALANAQTVASAAEQLAASIREIGGQVNQSTVVVGRAVDAGRETRATIEALNEKVGRIGAVADMISDIAAKTNLLALNATIEAARAGDAGKGFAVVASEVKQLATQTARSTEEISRHIGDVRAATGASVTAVGQIERTIGEIDAIAGSIAAAVEEQGAATAEIARNVSETAVAANAMTSRITEVSAEADRTGRHAAEVHDGTSGLTEAIKVLRHSVIRIVRASTAEVDRRGALRVQVDLGCRLDIAGQATHAARIVDLSESGASVRGGPAMETGDHGTVSLDGYGLGLTFTVRATEGETRHLDFALDGAMKAGLRALLERLAQQVAA